MSSSYFKARYLPLICLCKICEGSLTALVNGYLGKADADGEDGCGEQRGVEQPGPGVPVQQVAQVYPLDGPRPQGDVQDGHQQRRKEHIIYRRLGC